MLSPKPGGLMLMCVSLVRHIPTQVHIHSAVSLAYHLNAALLIINSMNYLEISNKRKCNGRATDTKGAKMNASVFGACRVELSSRLA